MRTSALNRVKNTRFLAGILPLLFAREVFGSFGAGNVNFLDRFFTIGVLFGVMGGIPLTAIAFTVFNVLACNKQRSRMTVALLGAIFGSVSWLIAAAVMAIGLEIDISGKPGAPSVPEILAMATLIILAIASAAFARSAPPVEEHVEAQSKP